MLSWCLLLSYCPTTLLSCYLFCHSIMPSFCHDDTQSCCQDVIVLNAIFLIVQGVSKKSLHSWGNQILGTSYSETTYQLGLKLWQQGVLMRTPSCQSLRSNRLVVSEYEVHKVWFPKSVYFFVKHPVHSIKKIVYKDTLSLCIKMCHINVTNANLHSL